MTSALLKERKGEDCQRSMGHRKTGKALGRGVGGVDKKPGIPRTREPLAAYDGLSLLLLRDPTQLTP